MAEDTFTNELNRPKANGTSSPRYFYLVSRKSSQPSTLNSTAGKAGEGEAKRDEDPPRCHRRGCSSASRESYDNPLPDSTASANKASPRKGRTPRTSEDSQSSFPNPETPSRAPKTAPTLTRSHSSERPTQVLSSPDFKRSSSDQLCTPEKPSQIPKAPGSSTNQLWNRKAKVQSQTLARSKMADQEEVNGSIRDDRDVKDREDDNDDDASYPELDDMDPEEIHRPPPRNPNGGIRWAPWNVPFSRRGQTLVVLMHSLSIVATVSLFFAFCANPFAWPLLLLYLLHVLSSKEAMDGSLHRSEWLRKSYIWHLFADYYPARLHKTHELPMTRKYIFGYHPHGIISHGAWAAFATDALGFSQKFPGITNSLLTLDSNFRIPFYREYILSMGVRSVSKESIVNILNRGGHDLQGMGRGVTIVVGGARESLEAQPGVMRLILNERKGFIKLAVRCGADLVPVLAFGENNLYDQLQPQQHPFVHKIQMFILKVWKFTLPFLHGRGVFNYDVGLMPYRRPLNIVVGAPIKVKKSATVNLEEINKLHSLYVAELEKLWHRYKDEFAPDRKEELQFLS
ncbi:diacylglycerol acyltransferase-domain-containing protein [Xylaria bambusicola]|uniref:diacylglycerol acyltransferase-domain-containing protein n=1 Tax=Xylaria bambusicola TaxID=326684 RepID=UPI0020085808|nr:diacylglycerol acyltransferase-domain-containing protein [Xylaria bambusicola]KAI0525845.1 diacylglycerol acyltransferase-domain-containing protein [Xylaria bambusicola]